ncbi:RadC family protein [Listeria grayi]|uniref:DNA repair protein RadC n=1 Tax=Listeria grayi DSM 20601 TaxID=525367 RepID=D7UYY9_LISGR|nr:DNA repair protein RadC [Listeria grayi]EFI83556.1 putative DNA repair protein RadC [Listeria grayi DSM 20601]
MQMKEMQIFDKPREKMQTRGQAQLTITELLAILLETGTKEDSVLSLANKIILKYKSLGDIKDLTIEELRSINGIGLAKATKIMAAIEIGKRICLQSESEKNNIAIRSPQDAVSIVLPELAFLFQEHFHCVLLNTRNQIVHRQTIFIGSLNASIVHPREVYGLAVRKSAAQIMCFHNHPSGDPTPSPEDIQVTKNLAKAGDIIGIPLIDHIIIGKGSFTSLKEQGYF